jgi:hypothetical protein
MTFFGRTLTLICCGSKDVERIAFDPYSLEVSETCWLKGNEIVELRRVFLNYLHADYLSELVNVYISIDYSHAHLDGLLLSSVFLPFPCQHALELNSFEINQLLWGRYLPHLFYFFMVIGYRVSYPCQRVNETVTFN